MKGKIEAKIVLLGLLILAISCTKEKPFEAVPNKKTLDKSIFVDREIVSQDGAQVAQEKPIERIAVMSYGLSSRRAMDAMPYFQGRTKLVAFEIGEKSMDVREIELDDRFLSNPTNSKTIMTLPVRHVEYDCQRDAYGECQNKEIEDDRKDWKLRNLLEVDFVSSKIMDIDQLPVQLTNLYDNCYTETGTKLVNYEVSKDVFNFEVEKSYMISNLTWSCVGQLFSGGDFSLSDLAFDVRYFYSMIRSDKLASQQYRPVHYKVEDEGTFGFFDTRINKLDVDGGQVENKDIVLLNRWNPNKGTIEYKLSHEFYKPENDYVLSATLEGIKRVNQGLFDAGTGLQIKATQGTADTHVGDLRNTMIVLVEDPLAARIIGYGPSAAHPKTGEIVNARTVMYLGTIRGIIKRVYEEILDEEAAEREQAQVVAKIESQKGQSNVTLELREKLKAFKHMNKLKDRTKVSRQLQQLQKDLDTVGTAKLKSLKAGASSASISAKKKSNLAVSNQTADQILKSLRSFKKLEASNLLTEDGRYINKRIDTLSRLSATPEEVVNARFAFESSQVRKSLPDVLVPWKDLSDVEKELIIREVMPHVWIPTLVHEIGHNLGLRHNFAGSEDLENFYSAEELAQMGISRKIPYSSIMEYSYKTMNELPTLGKYDLAALRYAYAREVEAVDAGGGKHIYKISGTLKDALAEISANQHTLKDYKYCTDEHVSANPNCNRFDEGTNFVEIVEHFIRAYEENYTRLNTRDNRENFTLLNEGGYLGRIASNFYDIRLMFEIMDRISVQYGIPLNNAIWDQQLKDIKDAVVLGGNFLVDVVVQPDVHCGIAAVNAPTELIAVFSLKDIARFWNPQVVNCYSADTLRAFDELAAANGIPPGILIPAAQTGKFFKSVKDPGNSNPFADQIDVQGIWIDKMVALEFLVTRELGSTLFDQGTQTFLDIPEVGNRAINILGGLLLGQGGATSLLKDQSGRIIELIGFDGNPTNSVALSVEMGEEHTIQVPMIQGLSAYFGMPLQQTSYPREMVRTVRRYLPSLIHGSTADEVLTLFDVYTNASQLNRPVDEYNIVDVSRVRYYALPENQVANFSVTALKMGRILVQVPDERLEELVALLKSQAPLPEGATEVEKVAYQMGADVLEMYLSNDIKQPRYYEKLLSDLGG